MQKQNFIWIFFVILGFFVLSQAAFASGCQYFSPSEAQTVPAAAGTTYIIDGANGTDPANCAAPGVNWGTVGNTPYKTIACAMNRYVARVTPRFLIHAGKYNERFSVPNTWTYGSDEAHRTVIAAYGDGEVIIDGSVTKNLGSWSQYGGSVYQATFSVAPVNGLAALVIDDDFRSYHPAASLAEITAPGMWFYDAGSLTLYVWPASSVTGSPSGHDVVAVERDLDGTSKYGISINPGVNYLTISNVTVRGNPGANIFADALSPYNDHLKIENCKIAFSAKSGIWLGGSTNAEVVKNYFFANVLRNWPRGSWASTCSNYTAGGWPPSVAFLSNTNHVFEGNVVSWSNGEGIIFIDNGANGNGVAKNNIVHDSYSTNMYFDHGVNSTFASNIVYSQTPLASDIRQSGCSASDILGLTRRSRAAGIASANESYVSVPPIGSGNNILNNIIIGTRRGIGNGDETTGGGLRNENILNNTIIVPNYDPTQINDAITGLSVGYNNGNNLNSTIKNNVVIATNANTSVASWEATGNPTDTGVSWNNNLYYHPNNSSPFLFKSAVYDFSNWKTQTSQDNLSIEGNPLLSRTDWTSEFTAPSTHVNQCWDAYDYLGINVSDFQPQSGSPAIDAGESNVLVGNDFFENVRPAGIGYDMGAIEYGALPPAESNPPVISNGLPASILPFGTTSATVRVSTDENATCRYSTSTGQSFASMNAFTVTGTTSHSFDVTTANGSTYHYYIKCSDVFNNTDANDYEVIFSVASSSDNTAPQISFLAPVGDLAAGMTNTNLSLITDESATCKYSTSSSTAFASMSGTFETADGFSHSAQISGLTNGTTYNYYVRCQDANGNVNLSVTPINFNVKAKQVTYQQTLHWNASGDSVDQTLNGTTLTSAGTPTYVDGYDGTTNGARNLAISNNYVTLSKTADFNWQQGKMNFYFYPTTNVSNDVFTFLWASGKSLAMNSSSGGRFSVTYGFNSGSAVRYVDGLSINAWHQVEIEWDLSNQYFMVKIDGSALSTANSSPSWTVTPSNETLYIGRGATYTTYNKSYLDELYFYAPIADTTAPNISSVSSFNENQVSVEISWDTDEEATSQIEYGTTSAYGSTNVQDDSLKTNHYQKLTGLLAGTTYHYRVKSIDAAGNMSYSNDKTFTTLSSQDNVAPAAPSGLSVN